MIFGICLGSDDCSICFSDMGSARVTLACGHEFCRVCVERMAESYLSDTTSNEIRCPDMSCRHPILPSVFEEEMKIKLETERTSRKETREQLQNGNIQCEKCQVWIPKDSETCPQCNFAQTITLDRFSKPCPKCNVPVQRSEGCDHMNCSSCQTKFCYNCGRFNRQNPDEYTCGTSCDKSTRHTPAHIRWKMKKRDMEVESALKEFEDCFRKLADRHENKSQKDIQNILGQISKFEDKRQLELQFLQNYSSFENVKLQEYESKLMNLGRLKLSAEQILKSNLQKIECYRAQCTANARDRASKKLEVFRKSFKQWGKDHEPDSDSEERYSDQELVIPDDFVLYSMNSDSESSDDEWKGFASAVGSRVSLSRTTKQSVRDHLRENVPEATIDLRVSNDLDE